MKKINHQIHQCGLLLILLLGTTVSHAGSQLPHVFKEGARFAWDFSSRSVYQSASNQWGAVNAVGLDYAKAFSGSYQDVGTLVAQAYYTRIDDVHARPAFFEDEHDGELVYRIFNFNITALPGLLPNIRIGHMEVPYGLEQTLDTNGTLRQYSPMQNLGIKADWGVSINQQHRGFEYEVAVSSGGGQSLARQDGSYVVSGRFGSSQDRNVVVGGSFYRSLLGGVIRERVGLDLQYFFGRQTVFAEVSTGKNDADDVVNALVEFNQATRRESWLWYVQTTYHSQHFAGERDNKIGMAVGMKYEPSARFIASLQVGKTLQSPDDQHPGTLSLQARYRI